MYKRDFAVLLLSVCALYVSMQNEGTFTFKKAWYFQFEDSGGLLEQATVLPPPLVADLNGDGKPEVITATPEGDIKVLAPRRFGDGFAQARVLSELSIAGGDEVRIASLTSGYLTPPPKELVRAPRKQVLVVVTSQLRVVCYDHNLKQLWEQDLQGHFPPHGSIRELAVHISEHAISQGDRGLVVVGASVVPLTLADRLAQEDAVEEEEEAEEVERTHSRGLKQAAEGEGAQQGAGGMGAATVEQEDTSREGRHFSYFAFEGSKGVLRWKHEAEDFVKDLGASQEELVAAHSYRLRAEQAEARHYGELSCRAYRESILAVLPHSWHSNLDTRLQLARFEKHREGKGAQKEQLSKLATAKGRPAGGGRSLKSKASDANPVTDVLASVIRGAMHGGTKHKGSSTGPNVLVAHVEEGIEAVHLYSGRTVCRLHLPSPGLNADINGDGVPDHIAARGGDPSDLLTRSHTSHAGATSFCTVAATSGVPPTQPLFNGTICLPYRKALTRTSGGLAPVEVAPPVMLPLPGKHGHYRIGRVGQKGLVVFLNSRGDVTVYDAQGELLWQVPTGATWSGYQYEEEEEAGLMPATLQAMPLRPGAVPTVILAGGSYTAVVLSEHGRELASLDLPELPTQPLVVTDFNFDGYNDILLIGRDGLYAWAQVRRPGAVPFSALVGGLIVILVGVFVTQQGFMQQGGKRKGRSTDRVD